jgi:hypothetical protein
MTSEDEATHLKARPWYTRNDPLDRSSKMKHRIIGHCHRPGDYRGAAHANCSINYGTINYCQ